MGSTKLMTYLNYISDWSVESDDKIQCLIDEFKAFVKLSDLNPEPVIDAEFTDLVNSAKAIRDETVAADATQLVADGAAVAAIWSFGLSMAAFVAAEVAEAIEKAVISKKSKELNKKLKNLDSTLTSKMGSDFETYITEYKANNKMIAEQAATGLDKKLCRSYLMQFMAHAERRKVTSFDVATFRKYATVARRMFNSTEIKAVYDALDDFVLEDCDHKALMRATGKFFDALNVPQECYFLVGAEVLSMMLSAGLAPKVIGAAARMVEYPIEEVEAVAVEVSEVAGTVLVGVGAVMGVVDAILTIINIVDVVEQYDKWIAKLDGPMKKHYKDYFNGIVGASKKYKKAVGLN